MINLRKALLVSLVLLGGLLTALISASAASAAVTCDFYASPAGAWNGDGSLSNPVQTVAELDTLLGPGQTGCLQSGDYGSITTNTDLYSSGTPGAQITITPAPGATTKITGLIMLWGNYTSLSGLTIDGSNTAYSQERPGTSCPYPVSNGLEINGTNDIFEYNNFYESVPSLRGNGIGVGWNGQANDTIIRYNRIHDVGQCMAQDHLIYLAHSNGTQIYDNWMWNDPHGWGVQVYPGASDSNIYDNVIDHAGSGFVVGGSSQVANNVIDHNIVMNSTGPMDSGLNGVGISTCCGIGPGNSFTDNIVYNNPGGISAATGMTVSDNTTSNPELNDPAANDYRPTVNLPGFSLWDGGLGAISIGGGGSGGSTPPTSTAPTPAPSTTPTPAPPTTNPSAPTTTPTIPSGPSGTSKSSMHRRHVARSRLVCTSHPGHRSAHPHCARVAVAAMRRIRHRRR
jgi:hypothetical protein